MQGIFSFLFHLLHQNKSANFCFLTKAQKQYQIPADKQWMLAPETPAVNNAARVQKLNWTELCSSVLSSGNPWTFSPKIVWNEVSYRLEQKKKFGVNWFSSWTEVNLKWTMWFSSQFAKNSPELNWTPATLLVELGTYVHVKSEFLHTTQHSKKLSEKNISLYKVLTHMSSNSILVCLLDHMCSVPGILHFHAQTSSDQYLWKGQKKPLNPEVDSDGEENYKTSTTCIPTLIEDKHANYSICEVVQIQGKQWRNLLDTHYEVAIRWALRTIS